MVRNIRNLFFYIIAAFYVFMMMDLFFRFSYIINPDRMISRSHNFIPFKTIWAFTKGNTHSISYAANNILGNIAVFVPYGLYLQVMRKNKAFVKSLFTVTLTSIAIEMIQFIFGLGTGDIDDVILNTCGGIIGILAYRFLRKVFRTDDRAKTAVTVFAFVLGAPVIYLYFTTVFGRLRL